MIAHAKVAKDAKVALLRSVSAGSLSFGGFKGLSPDAGRGADAGIKVALLRPAVAGLRRV